MEGKHSGTLKHQSPISTKMLLIALHIESSMSRDRAGYMNRDTLSTFVKRALSHIEMSLCNHMFNSLSSLGEKFICCSSELFQQIGISKFLTLFSLKYYILYHYYISFCTWVYKHNIPHCEVLSVKPDARENLWYMLQNLMFLL